MSIIELPETIEVRFYPRRIASVTKKLLAVLALGLGAYLLHRELGPVNREVYDALGFFSGILLLFPAMSISIGTSYKLFRHFEGDYN